MKKSLFFPILLFSSISLHWSLRKAFFSHLGNLWNFAFKWEYISFSPLPFASLLFSAICNVTSDSHFAFLFLENDLDHSLLYNVTNSVYSSSGTLSDLIPWIYLSLPLYNRKGFDLVVFLTSFNLTLNLAIWSSWSEPQSAPSLVFADCVVHLRLQRI